MVVMMMPSDFLDPSSDHEALMLISQRLDSMDESIKKIQVSVTDVATRQYVDDSIARVNARLDTYIEHGRSSSGVGSAFLRVMQSSVGKTIVRIIVVVLLVGVTTITTVSTANMNGNIQQIMQTLK